MVSRMIDHAEFDNSHKIGYSLEIFVDHTLETSVIV